MAIGAIQLFPVLGVCALVAALCICYPIAVTQGHVPAGFPFISNTGSERPESCLFSIFFNIGSMFGCLTFIARYRMLKLYFGGDDIRLSRLNLASFIVGIFSTFGICVVGNFQANGGPWVKVVHWVGAGFAFALGVIYTCLQAGITTCEFTNRRGRELLRQSERWLVSLRFSLAAGSLVVIIVFVVSMSVAVHKYDGDNQLFWEPEKGGYIEHEMSVAAEWLLFFVLLASILTYVVEFRFTHFSQPKLHFVRQKRIVPVHVLP